MCIFIWSHVSHCVWGRRTVDESTVLIRSGVQDSAACCRFEWCSVSCRRRICNVFLWSTRSFVAKHTPIATAPRQTFWHCYQISVSQMMASLCSASSSFLMEEIYPRAWCTCMSIPKDTRSFWKWFSSFQPCFPSYLSIISLETFGWVRWMFLCTAHLE